MIAPAGAAEREKARGGPVGRAFFVLQTGSIFSQKAGEHRGNRLCFRERNNGLRRSAAKPTSKENASRAQDRTNKSGRAIQLENGNYGAVYIRVCLE